MLLYFSKRVEKKTNHKIRSLGKVKKKLRNLSAAVKRKTKNKNKERRKSK